MQTYREFIADTKLKLEPYGTTAEFRSLFGRILQLLREFEDWPHGDVLQKLQRNLQDKHDQLIKMGQKNEAGTVRKIAQNLQAARNPPPPA